jgi:hypothetical protein
VADRPIVERRRTIVTDRDGADVATFDVGFVEASPEDRLAADVRRLCERRGWRYAGSVVELRRGRVTLNLSTLARDYVSVDSIEAMIDRQATVGALADRLDAGPVEGASFSREGR